MISSTTDTDSQQPQQLVTCLKIQDHVLMCQDCQKILSYDPIEKSLLKTSSIKNDILELFTFLITGVVLLTILYFIVQLKKMQI